MTGAGGFIGGHTALALTRAGHQVFPLDKRWDTSTVSLAVVDDVRSARPDVIVHLGAQCSTGRSLQDPWLDFTDNAVGTVNLAEAARLAGNIPVIFTSTCKVNRGVDGQVAPLGLSKKIGEDYLRMYDRVYGVPSVVLRPSTVYGPGQDGSAEAGWVTWFARAAVKGLPVVVNGDGRQTRDVLYVDDMVALLVDIVTNFDEYHDAFTGPVPVGGGDANEVGLLELLGELGHSDIEYGPLPVGDIARVASSNWLVSSVRGWAPTVGWRDGLARTVAWLREEGADRG